MKTKGTASSRNLPQFGGTSQEELNRICTSFFPGFSALEPEAMGAIIQRMTQLRSVLLRMYQLHRVDPLQLWIPFPWQLKKLQCRKKFNFALGANRPGKTDWLVADAALTAESRHPYQRTPKNAQIYLSVLTFKKIEQVILPKFREKLRPQGKYWGYNQTTQCISIIAGKGKGNKIFLLSEEQGVEAYDSFAANKFYIDEEHSEKVFGRILARCIDHSAQVCLAATPENGLTYTWHNYWQPWREGKNHDLVDIVELSMYDNPTLDKKQIDMLFEELSRQDPLIARIKVLGEPLNLAGTPYFNLNVLDMMIKAASSVYSERCELQEVPA